jgi:phosphohistidine phosphatase
MVSLDAESPERTLIVLRHAKSDWSAGQADFDRGLAERGLRQAPLAGRWLADSIRRIDLAVVSPAYRALSTWELASAELDVVPPTRVEDELYAASVDTLLGVIRDLPADANTVILVGHNPAVEDLVLLLTGESVSMPTSALAVIGWAGSWSAAGESAATLRAFGRPPR